jgi:hypothetical protein
MGLFANEIVGEGKNAVSCGVTEFLNLDEVLKTSHDVACGQPLSGLTSGTKNLI